MAIVTVGSFIVFGVRDRKPILDLPPAVLQVKVRMRAGQWAAIYLRFVDRVEQWSLTTPDNRSDCQTWKLHHCMAINDSSHA